MEEILKLLGSYQIHKCDYFITIKINDDGSGVLLSGADKIIYTFYSIEELKKELSDA